MKKFEVENHAPSFLPKEKKWKLVWHDEFDGTKLDTSKWGFRRYFWGEKAQTFIGEEGLEFDGISSMKMHLIEKDGDFYSCQLQTGSITYDYPKDSDGFWPFGKYEEPKFMHKYGYYEIRCRLPKNAGWHAAFWLQAPGIGAHPDPRYGGVEMDIMENYLQHTDGVIICGNGYNGYGKDCVFPGHKSTPYVETPDGWHYYGLDWNKDGYVFYIDGKEVHRLSPKDCPVSQVEQFILVTTEAHGYNRIFGKEERPEGKKLRSQKPVEALKKAVLPDYFEVDFVRVYDEIVED